MMMMMIRTMMQIQKFLKGYTSLIILSQFYSPRWQHQAWQRFELSEPF